MLLKCKYSTIHTCASIATNVVFYRVHSSVTPRCSQRWMHMSVYATSRICNSIGSAATYNAVLRRLSYFDDYRDTSVWHNNKGLHHEFHDSLWLTVAADTEGCGVLPVRKFHKEQKVQEWRHRYHCYVYKMKYELLNHFKNSITRIILCM